jgi:hypothetical protein
MTPHTMPPNIRVLRIYLKSTAKYRSEVFRDETYIHVSHSMPFD